MSEIKEPVRYDVVGSPGDWRLITCEDGEYVLHKDYKKVRDALEVLDHVMDRCLGVVDTGVPTEEVIEWMREAKAKADEVLKGI